MTFEHHDPTDRTCFLHRSGGRRAVVDCAPAMVANPICRETRKVAHLSRPRGGRWPDDSWGGAVATVDKTARQVHTLPTADDGQEWRSVAALGSGRQARWTALEILDVEATGKAWHGSFSVANGTGQAGRPTCGIGKAFARSRGVRA